MTEIPEGLPTLAAGAHQPGSAQACVMEYVALLAGEPWTDRPKCTHPALGDVARIVNDRMTDDHRHKLIPLINRLFGTSEDPEGLFAAEVIRQGRLAAHWVVERLTGDLRKWERQLPRDLHAKFRDPYDLHAKNHQAKYFLGTYDDFGMMSSYTAATLAVNAAVSAAGQGPYPLGSTAEQSAAYAVAGDEGLALAGTKLTMSGGEFFQLFAQYKTKIDQIATFQRSESAMSLDEAANLLAREATRKNYGPNQNAGIELLTGLLDDYDKLTGRATPAALDKTELTKLNDKLLAGAVAQPMKFDFPAMN